MANFTEEQEKENPKKEIVTSKAVVNTPGINYFINLPAELIKYIAAYLPLISIGRLRRINRLFNSVLENNGFWKLLLWRDFNMSKADARLIENALETYKDKRLELVEPVRKKIETLLNVLFDSTTIDGKNEYSMMHYGRKYIFVDKVKSLLPEIISEAVTVEINPNLKYATGKTLLWAAMRYGNPADVEKVLSLPNMDVNVVDEIGYNVLTYYIAVHPYSSKDKTVGLKIEMLAKAGLNLDFIDPYGDTALIALCNNRYGDFNDHIFNESAVITLLNEGASQIIKKEDKKIEKHEEFVGKTALQIACDTKSPAKKTIHKWANSQPIKIAQPAPGKHALKIEKPPEGKLSAKAKEFKPSATSSLTADAAVFIPSYSSNSAKKDGLQQSSSSKERTNTEKKPTPNSAFTSKK